MPAKHSKPEDSDWPQEPWCEDDRLWFKDRPGRRYRIRRTPPGEMEAFGEQIKSTPRPASPTHGRPHWDYTIVIQIVPGARMRYFILLFDYIESPDLHWPDDNAAWAFIQHIFGKP